MSEVLASEAVWIIPRCVYIAGEFEEGIKQIGNCVPPLLVKAIAECLRRDFLGGAASQGPQ
jgi:site-specific DNA-cytosine methylase